MALDVLKRSSHGDLHYPPPGSAHHDRHHLRVHRSTASLLLLMAAVWSEARRPRTRPLRHRAPPRGHRAGANHDLVRVDARPSHILPGEHVERRRVAAVEGRRACLLGKSWGYDQASVWVSDGCSADFATGAEHGPPDGSRGLCASYNVCFFFLMGEKGRSISDLMSYGRYLNQRNLDETYVDAFGNTKTVQRRQDVQLQKFFAPFSGWFLTPKLRYYLYVWSSNASQGDPAQVVGAGNLSYASTGT